MSQFYKNYLTQIDSALKNGPKRRATENFSGLGAINENRFLTRSMSDADLFNSLNFLEGNAKNSRSHEMPGSHPHFSHLKNSSETEQHYITSMFIDIKNSTSLFKKYEPTTVAYITSTIQLAAIHTCWYFNGYVQRFHGDGLFIYFGGEHTTIQQSASDAIKAASFFNHFVSTDIQNVFEQQGVDKMYTRIGIDTGESEDVLWFKAGIEDCSEITTCSLHTSLAAHMQANATNNGIMLGDNVKKHSGLSKDFFSIRMVDNNTREDRYIFRIPEEGFYYTQWQFDWKQYLINFLSSNQSPLKHSEKDALETLRETAGLVSSGNAYTNSFGLISNQTTGTKNEPHRFHYDEKKA